MKLTLTTRQQDILDFIETFSQERGYPPTLREIGNQFGISSTNGVRVNLAALEKKQYIRRLPWLSRGIELVNIPRLQQTDGQVSYVPVISKVAKGTPIFAAENIAGMLAVDDSFFSAQKAFAVRVHDDSMSDAGILKDDFLLVKRQQNVETGNITIFIIGEDITIRRYDTVGNMIKLIPANDNYETQLISRSSHTLQIGGKVMGLIRKY
jgi:repressor LexA